MISTERILVEILARFQLRVMAKRQSALIKPDSIDQNKLGEISERIDSRTDTNNNDSLLEKADDALK